MQVFIFMLAVSIVALLCGLISFTLKFNVRCRHRWSIWYGYTNKLGKTKCVYKCIRCGMTREEER